MNYSPIIFVLIIINTIWLILLTYGLISFLKPFKKAGLESKKINLRNLFDRIFFDFHHQNAKIHTLEKQTSVLSKAQVENFQKVFIHRFNPFAESGSDQSFVIVLLNGNNSGVILTSLHSRSESRIYAKPIENGRSIRYKLSEEEKIALNSCLQKH